MFINWRFRSLRRYRALFFLHFNNFCNIWDNYSLLNLSKFFLQIIFDNINNFALQLYRINLYLRFLLYSSDLFACTIYILQHVLLLHCNWLLESLKQLHVILFSSSFVFTFLLMHMMLILDFTICFEQALLHILHFIRYCLKWVKKLFLH